MIEGLVVLAFSLCWLLGWFGVVKVATWLGGDRGGKGKPTD